MQHLTNNTFVPTLPDPGLQGIHNFFLPCQLRFINDPSRKRIAEKSRQTGISLNVPYDLVRKTSPPGSSSDAWVSSHDGSHAQPRGQDCAYWARSAPRVTPRLVALAFPLALLVTWVLFGFAAVQMLPKRLHAPGFLAWLRTFSACGSALDAYPR
jgi:hypothetical protein